jgi:hypothetical protein
MRTLQLKEIFPFIAQWGSHQVAGKKQLVFLLERRGDLQIKLDKKDFQNSM